ncbi:hypothetical protein H072_2443 [Dactylellina haptotyla CBS 200.50]|uniref:Uncharacterized protein n=1 Tax=Dactylellina haptotyla (strain CBS 200.50) TaxID=1284197 RepID=S8BVQ2_DACHA|nr:hypothetical protein H072_2443 [Dactylellina haptotyla CBS 200.50]
MLSASNSPAQLRTLFTIENLEPSPPRSLFHRPLTLEDFLLNVNAQSKTGDQTNPAASKPEEKSKLGQREAEAEAEVFTTREAESSAQGAQVNKKKKSHSKRAEPFDAFPKERKSSRLRERATRRVLTRQQKMLNSTHDQERMPNSTQERILNSTQDPVYTGDNVNQVAMDISILGKSLKVLVDANRAIARKTLELSIQLAVTKRKLEAATKELAEVEARLAAAEERARQCVGPFRQRHLLTDSKPSAEQIAQWLSEN